MRAILAIGCFMGLGKRGVAPTGNQNASKEKTKVSIDTFVLPQISLEQAADLLNVSPRLVARRHLNESQRAVVAAKLATMIGTAGGRPSKTVQICMVTKDKAAELLNVSPRLVARRHLNESQRAVIAARLANMTRGGIRPGQNTKTSQTANLQFEGEISQSTAAELLNVSPPSLRQGWRI